MTEKKIKILCVDKKAQVCKLIGTVFNAIPHEIKCVQTNADILSLVQERNYDLIVADIQSFQFNNTILKRLRLTHPYLHIILIVPDLDKIKDWVDDRRVRLIRNDILIEKLPLVLSEFYSNIDKDDYNGLAYQNLLRQSLMEIEDFVAVVNVDSQMIFLNSVAEKLFGYTGEDYKGTFLSEFLADGAKVWKFLVDCQNRENGAPEIHNVTIIDFHNEEHVRELTVKRLDIQQELYLIQAKSITDKGLTKPDEGNYEILKTFADAIANELLNPVNIISGRVQLLENELPDNPAFQKSITALEKQLQRINETMFKLLTFARLKQDTIPQKININELLKRIRLEPSIIRLIEQDEKRLLYALEDNVPVLSGSISHYDLFLKTLIELSLHCLGVSGRIELFTGKEEQYLNKNWVKLEFVLYYSSSIFGQDNTLENFLAKNDRQTIIKSIETTIISHVIRHYRGMYRIKREDQNTEKMTVLFPVA